MARKRIGWFWQLVFIALIGVGFYYIEPLSRCADQATAHIAYPILIGYSAVIERIHRSNAWLESKECLREQAARLQQERDTMLAELIILRAQQRYYDDIQEMRAFKERYRQVYNAAIVHVLLKHVGDDEQYFLVEGGLQQGFSQDMIAVCNNHLVGRVVEAYPSYSKIQLITDRSLKVAAYCAKTGAQGIYTGLGKLTVAALAFVDHLQVVEVGDMVLSTGSGLIYPQGLCLGGVANVEKKDIECVIAVRPLIALDKIEYCLLMPRQSVSPSCTLLSTPMPHRSVGVQATSDLGEQIRCHAQ